MEINGVANIHCIVDMALDNDKIDPAVVEAIKKELNLLERYLLAYADCLPTPFWHEVRANPEQYPTNSQRVSGFKQKIG